MTLQGTQIARTNRKDMYWPKVIGIILAVLCFGTLVVYPLRGEDGSPQPTGNSSIEQHPAYPWSDESGFDIREDIRKAQEFLRHKKSGYTVRIEKTTVRVTSRRGKTREKVVKRKIIEPAFLLAVENLKERRIRQVRFTSKGCETDGFDVVMTRNNGVGSRFEIRYPENMALLALRTMVHSGNKGYEEVVYTPYSPEIDTPQVREDGLNYLKGQLESARADLEEKHVRLMDFNELFDGVAATEISLVLSIIEHIDPVRFEKSPPGGETALVHEVLTIIGANTSAAYAYSRSPAGARGLFQFIPGTYEKLLRKYPEARLDRNFVSGCSNHVNAAKASLLLFDSDLNDLPSDYLHAIGADALTVGRYLAAAYNCGSKRVERSLRGCTAGWTCLLPRETKVYLRKFDAVWNMRKLLDMQWRPFPYEGSAPGDNRDLLKVLTLQPNGT